MGNPTLHYPGDAPTPCWTCAHLEGLHTRWVGAGEFGGFVSITVTCAERGLYCHANVSTGCRFWREQPKPPAPGET